MKYFLVIFVSVLLITSCRKKEEREYQSLDSIGALHCSNGIVDADEWGEDCGGSDCSECDQNQAPCTLASNTIYVYDGSFLSTKQFTGYSIDTAADGTIDFYGYVENSSFNYLHIKFNVVSVTTVYDGVKNEFDLDEDNQVFAEYVDTGLNSDLTGFGDVYVNRNSEGELNIQSCYYSFSSLFVNEPPQEQWFNITFTL